MLRKILNIPPYSLQSFYFIIYESKSALNRAKLESESVRIKEEMGKEIHLIDTALCNITKKKRKDTKNLGR